MQLDDFDYPLPPAEQIAQYPLENRTQSRLLCYDRKTQQQANRQFSDIIDYLLPGDLLVFNNTKVIPARLFGRKSTGGQVEILVERVLDATQFLAHVRASKALKAGARVVLEGEGIWHVEMLSRQDDLFLFALLDHQNINDCLEACGHMPLPPYIQRADILSDQTRYQTVYAERAGAVAAPTAGLHFDKNLMQQLEQKNIQQAFLTLHVGAGTFQPVRVDNIAEHKMHAEYADVSQVLCEQIQQTKQHGGRVIAVGTTVVRALETAAQTGILKPYCGETDIFITPGYTFHVIDAMITNFHWPRSTLLMLIAAFSSRDTVLALYKEAITAGYRFFSYGDAMLLL